MTKIVVGGVYITLTELKGGTIHKLPFGVNTMTELKNITPTSDNNGKWLGMFRLTTVSVLSDVFLYIYILSSIVVRNPNGNL